MYNTSEQFYRALTKNKSWTRAPYATFLVIQYVDKIIHVGLSLSSVFNEKNHILLNFGSLYMYFILWMLSFNIILH